MPEEFTEAEQAWLAEQVEALRLTDDQCERAAQILGRDFKPAAQGPFISGTLVPDFDSAGTETSKIDKSHFQNPGKSES